MLFNNGDQGVIALCDASEKIHSPGDVVKMKRWTDGEWILAVILEVYEDGSLELVWQSGVGRQRSRLIDLPVLPVPEVLLEDLERIPDPPGFPVHVRDRHGRPGPVHPPQVDRVRVLVHRELDSSIATSNSLFENLIHQVVPPRYTTIRKNG